jgi:hypothetical protein
MAKQPKHHTVAHIRIWMLLKHKQRANCAGVAAMAEGNPERRKHLRAVFGLKQSEQRLDDQLMGSLLWQTPLPEHINPNPALARIPMMTEPHGFGKDNLAFKTLEPLDGRPCLIRILARDGEPNKVIDRA